MPDVPDYDLPDSVSAKTAEQIKAITEPTRLYILDLVLDRAATVTELAEALGRPKSSVAYHVDTLIKAGMLRVVRTRKVRAIEERFYGRTGRTIAFGDAALPEGTIGRNLLVDAASEARPGHDFLSTIRHARISEDQAAEFFERVAELAEDFTRLSRSGDTVIGFVAAVYETDHPSLPEPSADSSEKSPSE